MLIIKTVAQLMAEGEGFVVADDDPCGGGRFAAADDRVPAADDDRGQVADRHPTEVIGWQEVLVKAAV